MEPVRLLWVRLRTERKERLPMWGATDPTSAMPGNDRAVTRCRRRLHETPTQRQKDVLVVQLSARRPRGSASRALKASSAARSVSLPLAGTEEEEQQVETAESRMSSRMMGMRTDDGAAAMDLVACLSCLSRSVAVPGYLYGFLQSHSSVC